MSAIGMEEAAAADLKPNAWYYLLVLLAASVLFSPSLSLGSDASGQEFKIKATDLLLPIYAGLLAMSILAVGSFPLSRAIRFIVLYFSLYFAGIFVYYFSQGPNPLSPILFWGKQFEYFLICYIAYFSVVRNPGSTGRVLGKMTNLIFVSYVLNALFIIYQAATGDYYGVARAYESRASVLFDPAVGASGQFMILSFLFLIHMRKSSRLLKNRYAYYSIFFILPFSLMAIGSTSSIFSLVLAAAAAVFFLRTKRLVPYLFRSAIFMAAVAALFVLIFGEQLSHQIDYVYERFLRVKDVVVALSLVSLGNRYYAWQETAGKISESPVFGHGTSSVPMTDNQYLKMLGEFGAVGFGVFMLVFIYLLFRYRRLSFSTKAGPADLYARFMFISTLAILFHGLVADIFQPVRIMEPYWLLTGVFWGIYYVRRKKVKSGEGAMEPAVAYRSG